MIVDTIVYSTFNKLAGKNICIFGTDERAVHCINYLKEHHPDITIKFLFTFGPTTQVMGYSAFNIGHYRKWHDLSSLVVVIATTERDKAARLLIDHEPAELYICSREVDDLFVPPTEESPLECRTIPFTMESITPKIPLVITEGAVCGEQQIVEVIDFNKQESTLYTYKRPYMPISLRDFSAQVEQSKLPMRMTHLDYLQWKRSLHLVQMSPSRRFIIGTRYNFYHLDILDTTTMRVTQWHDKPASEGLWDYVATGCFDEADETFYFVRWPLADAMEGMRNGTNKVHCEVGRLDLTTMRATILADFDFVDRVHQITMSGDNRYMVFAPMRVLKTPVSPSLLKEEEVMRKLQEWTVLDDMATLDLKTGKVSFTRIPFPIPAHFELDPLDPHVFYVSTHSLLPHQEGVLVFNPSTIHRLRITDGVSVIEKTYTHPGFIRGTQHCPFVFNGKVLIATTNQNKLEIIDAETMEAYYIHKLLDDAFYDNADFNNPEFMSKPFSLPTLPAHCDSIAPSADGNYLALHLPQRYLIFSMLERKIVGSVNAPEGHPRQSHTSFYMRNALHHVATQRYEDLYSKQL